jgi:transcriptional regulator with XRE-family HTH domain
MDQQAIIAEIEERAKKLGLSISEVCRRAGVHPTTFSRWKLSELNPDPVGATIKSLRALTDVLDGEEGKGPEADEPAQAAA